MTERTASCACGAVTARCAGEPELVAMCYCRQCQKRTGSTHGLAAFFDRESVACTGPTTRFTRAADNGHKVDFHFCISCGSTVYWYPARMPHLIAVAVGTFTDPDFPPPAKQVFTELRPVWMKSD
jgi:hypothetical protein